MLFARALPKIKGVPPVCTYIFEGSHCAVDSSVVGSNDQLSVQWPAMNRRWQPAGGVR
jgi:hypothetical protein